MISKIAMTSVYMDKGEGSEYLSAQIARMAKQGIDRYFLDIICLPDQVRDATKLLGEFYEQVADMLPLAEVFAAITCNDLIRPSAIAVAALTSGSSVQFKDVNPERPGR